MKAVIILSFFSLAPVYAVPTGKITDVKGEVKFSKRILKEGDILAEDGILSAGKDSFVKIHVDFWKGYLLLMDSSSLSIKFWQKGEKREYNLERGQCRWIDGKEKEAKVIVGRHINTSNAVVKILRGNVIVSYNDILKETQLLVLSGQAVFQSRKDPNDRIVLKKGLWGGIGGRFRDIIGETVVLSSSVQKQFIDRKL